MQEPIDMYKALKVLSKRRGLVVWSTIVCTAVALFITAFILPVRYSSSVDILVNRKTENSQANLLQSQMQVDLQMINTYKDIIMSRTTLESVSREMRRLGYDVTVQEAKKAIKISSKTNSQVFSVAVSEKTARMAADMAIVVADEFKKKVETVMSVDNVSVLSRAIVNEKPSFPKVWLNVAAGVLGGLIIGMGAALFAERFDRKITDEKFITEELGLNDLGIIGEIPEKQVRNMIMRERRKGEKTQMNRRV